MQVWRLSCGHLSAPSFVRSYMSMVISTGKLSQSLGIRSSFLVSISSLTTPFYLTCFPVVPGILDYQGNNTIGLSIWAMDPTGGVVDVQLKVLGVQKSSYDVFFDSDYLRPGWINRTRFA